MSLSFTLFLQLYFTSGAIISPECMDQIEKHNTCRNRVDKEFKAEEEDRFMKQEPLEEEDDAHERSICTFLMRLSACAHHVGEPCFSSKEITFLRDNDVARYNVSKSSWLPNWEYEKCPPTRDYKKRYEEGYAGFPEECQQPIKDFRLCRVRAKEKYWEDSFDKKGDVYVAKFTEYEKYANVNCNYHTSLLSSCTSLLPSSCFSEDFWMKMKFWQFFDEAGVDPFYRSGVEKCPAVQEVFEAWEAAKKENMNATIKVDTANDTDIALEKRDLILVSKIMTVATNDLEKLPAILEATKTELVDELKKKALAANCKDITDFKIEIHSVSEGIFIMVIYATTVKF